MDRESQQGNGNYKGETNGNSGTESKIPEIEKFLERLDNRQEMAEKWLSKHDNRVTESNNLKYIQ